MWEKFFRRKPMPSVVQEMLYEAERLALEHQAAGEHHLALANMYKVRANRLQANVQQAARERQEQRDTERLMRESLMQKVQVAK